MGVCVCVLFAKPVSFFLSLLWLFVHGLSSSPLFLVLPPCPSPPPTSPSRLLKSEWWVLGFPPLSVYKAPHGNAYSLNLNLTWTANYIVSRLPCLLGMPLAFLPPPYQRLMAFLLSDAFSSHTHSCTTFT